MAQTTPPTIDPAPPVPIRGTSTFKGYVDGFLTWLALIVTQFAALAANVYANALDVFSNATSAAASATTATTQAAAALVSANSALASSGGTATSTTANTLAYGAFTITVQVSKAFVPGMSVKVAAGADPTKWLVGDVTAYNSGSGSLTVNATFLSGAATGSTWTVSVSGPGMRNLGFLHVRDEKASNTAGGSCSAATIQTRTLNTVKTNTISGASLASNQITLPAGTYRYLGSAPCFGGSSNAALFYNVTAASYAGIGCAETAAVGGASTRSALTGIVTLAVATVFEVRHYTFSAASTSGLGQQSQSGQIEVYAEITFEKVA
jgi:hypothetical protein